MLKPGPGSQARKAYISNKNMDKTGRQNMSAKFEDKIDKI
jgi:hypothetical protein